MRIIETREIDGATGKSYSMNVYPADMRFNDFIAGVFLLMAGDGTLLIGESDNVDMWLQKNEAASKLANEGFDKIGFIKNGSREVRQNMVSDLTEACSPKLAQI